MSLSRRNFLNKFLIAGAGYLTAISGLLAPIIARATWTVEKYARTDVDNTLTILLGDQKPQKSNKITIKIPEVAENGAIVPITIVCKLEQTQSISIIAEKNPVPLIAQFSFAPEMAKQVTARVKLGDSGQVLVLVRANDLYYIARRRVRVTVGGCGD